MLPKKTIFALLSLPCLVFLIRGQQAKFESELDVNDETSQSQDLPVGEAAALVNEAQNGSDDIVVSQDSLISVNAPQQVAQRKTIYVITPTYTRATQMADMTRLSQTLEVAALKYNQSIFWIVSEDSTHLSPQVAGLLSRTSVPSVHLLGPRPLTHLDKRSGRGVSNRLRALQWLRDTFTGSNEAGVIYFADDDNSYDARVFKEMEGTVKVSVWPVGLIAKTGVSTPIINNTTGLVQGFHDPYMQRRKFAVDMAGFAADLQLFLSNPKATMPYKVGYEEDFFIRSLGVKITDLEPKANNCTETLVWHTKTQPGVFPTLTNIQKDKSLESTNLPLLYRQMTLS